MPSHEESYVNVRGTRIHFFRGGQGEPMLWLHGAGGNPAWLPIYETLAGRFDLLVPEHPGFGLSDSPDWLEGVDDLVFFYLDFVKELGLSGVHLTGQSFGGWLAAELAVMTPAWLRSLTLVDAVGLDVPEDPPADLLVLSPAQRAELMAYRPPSPPPAPPTDAELQQRAKNDTTFARLVWQPYLCNPKLRRRLGRIEVPTLVVWGEHDRVVPRRHGEIYASEIPGARLVLIPESGHTPTKENPEAVAREVLAALG